MIFPPVAEIDFFGVYNPGLPNRECLVLQTKVAVNLAQLGILNGWRMPNGQAMPLWDNFFWFGDLQVSAQTWLVVMTCGGKLEATTHPNTGQPLFRFFWGRKATIYENSNVLPVLIQLGAVKIGERHIPQTLPRPSAQGLLQ